MTLWIASPEVAELFDRAMVAMTDMEAFHCAIEIACLRRDHFPREDPADAMRWAKKAIAYWAGYFTPDVRERVERLYRTVHPVLGAVGTETLSVAQLIMLGMTMNEFPWVVRSAPKLPVGSPS